MLNPRGVGTALVLLVIAVTGPATAGASPEQTSAASTGSLAAGFLNPPNSAKPRVWWHWMSGNVSAEGAQLDLEWMHRVGVGGVQALSGGSLGEPVVVKKPLPFMSEGWREVFRSSLETARADGMEFGIGGSPGWSETGGTWVPAADGMKKYVWSETIVEGGKPFTGKLVLPPSVTGPFQGKAGSQKASAYGDAAVVAFPTPAFERSQVPPSFTSSAGDTDIAPIAHGDFSGNAVRLDFGDAQESWIKASYPAPVTIGAVAVGIRDGAAVEVQVEQSSGGFTTIAKAEVEPALTPVDQPAPQQTLAFSPVTAQKFRIVFRASATIVRPLGISTTTVAPRRQTSVTLTEFKLLAGARVNRFEAKAGFQPIIRPEYSGSPEAPSEAAIDRKTVVNLTGRLHPDGSLTWTPPPGQWTVVRLGWSLTGAVNAPAEPSATGLEVDKLDAAAVHRYIGGYFDLYGQASGGKVGPSGIQTYLTDSWEAGVQNWTPAMLTDFRARRGYDATPFLPVLTGRVVASSEASERFLFDFQQTLKDLVADNHYGVLARETRVRGMRYYTEAQGDAPRAIGDGMTMKARADIPTGEFWYRPFSTLPGQPSLKADLEEAASAAHVYGKPFAAAESLTVAAPNDPWSFSPAMLKPVADEIFAHGVNRILMHESHHQPLIDAKPGLRLFIFGQFFNRNDTWAEQAAPWVSYLARSSYMLQQGRYVADVAYFYGEERNLTELFNDRVNTDVPKGYAYDYINPEALLTLLSVRDGRIVTPSGMSYRVLYLPDHVTHFTLPALRKIRDLVSRGAILVGPKPVGGLGVMSPDQDVLRLADQVWGDGADETHVFGKGRVYRSLRKALDAELVTPDVVFAGATADADLMTSHRHAPDTDIYFVSNQSDQGQNLQAEFRVTGRAPEIWHAETGTGAPISYAKTANGISAPLILYPHEAVFVVFRRPATASAWTAPRVQHTTLATLTGPWNVAFEAKRGAPPNAMFDRLISWTESADPGIKYFSGVATYHATIQATQDWLAPGRRIELDLGSVHELAVVSVNGKTVGTIWHAPYIVDITGALMPGTNLLDIQVVNLWPNRLIGDKQPGAEPVTFAPGSPYKADSPLLASGLLGPVQIVARDNANDGKP